jgi:hypothetical protein
MCLLSELKLAKYGECPEGEVAAWPPQYVEAVLEGGRQRSHQNLLISTAFCSLKQLALVSQEQTLSLFSVILSIVISSSSPFLGGS